MYASFNSSESINIAVENRDIPIQHYLRQSQRVVEAIANPRLMKQLEDNLYELKMRPINFMEIYHFQPIVILKVWSGNKGTVYLQSQGCEIKGIDYINRRFALKLKGILYPQETNGQTTLEGQADLEVSVEIPSALALTPKFFLERAGNKLLKSVLVRIKQKLTAQLVRDYQTWADNEEKTVSKNELGIQEIH
ncbi:DUF1997 domain-containing protein [Myxosarcina sp. GI1]|uniref:DUF1997 domain-containing protein n=1 Tax=Myxosarcina sp. GI1 TaxID=1541065 RepID=UPI000563DF81|nr:DUF1997 domain-containing protein [Myxosarcina sp. GI1]